MVERRKRNVRERLHSWLEQNLAFYESQGMSPEEVGKSKLVHTLLDDPSKVGVNYLAAIDAGLSRAEIEVCYPFLGKFKTARFVQIVRQQKVYDAESRRRIKALAELHLGGFRLDDSYFKGFPLNIYE